MVLTGYNTDIDFEGTTFHVQTEDKGRTNPYIESLVYARGEILYSKRTAYHDLVAQDVDTKAISSLMERQHRTLSEAIRRGRLAKLMGADPAPLEGPEIEDGSEAGTVAADAEATGPSLDEVILDYLRAQRRKAHLILNASGDQDFVYGGSCRVRIAAADSQDGTPQAGAHVTVLFKSTAEPRRLQLAEGETDGNGVFSATVRLPEFNGGTSAVVVVADSEIGQSEIKHLVHR